MFMAGSYLSSCFEWRSRHYLDSRYWNGENTYILDALTVSPSRHSSCHHTPQYISVEILEKAGIDGIFILAGTATDENFWVSNALFFACLHFYSCQLCFRQLQPIAIMSLLSILKNLCDKKVVSKTDERQAIC